MAVSVTDRWHKTQPKAGEPTCKEHTLVPTTAHGKGLRWQVRWDEWVNGVRHQPRRNFKYKVGKDPEIHADAFASKLQGELSTPPPDPQTVVTVRDACEQWAKYQSFTDTTEITVLSRIRNHITENAFGDTLAFDLAEDPNLVQLWLKDLAAKGLSPRSIRFAAGDLSTVLEYARVTKVIPSNPFRPMSPLIKLPRIPDKRVVPYSKQQLSDLERTLPAKYQMVPRVGSGLGLRIGEIIGLSPDDLDGNEARIQRQVRYSRKHCCYLFDLPKGQKTRVVPVSPSLQTFLASQPFTTVKLPWQSPTGKERSVKIFGSALGRPWVYQTLLYHWVRAHSASEIERLPHEDGFHKLRHTFASRVLAAGISVRTLSEWLGHKRASLTLDIYCHFIANDLEGLWRVLDE